MSEKEESKREISLSDVDESFEEILKLSDDDLRSLKFVMPWETYEDPGVDEFHDKVTGSTRNLREALQNECWSKFNKNPQVSTAVRGNVGRLTGLGFDTSSDVPKIQEVIEEIELDPRNRLYTFYPKWVGRSIIEGELFLCFTVHEDGFIEIDFLDPGDISGGGEDGVIYHPTKSTMPLFYFVKQDDGIAGVTTPILIPSIFIARYPELEKEAAKLNAYKGASRTLTKSKKSGRKFSKMGGYFRFIVAWDKSFMTKRNVSHLRTIIEWLNYYENLKKYEIDHKKSAGSYLWVVEMEDVKTFRMWAGLSDAERKQTGIMAKKTPGGTLIMPPGMKITCQNPSLPNISESDTDIFHMITSGLNEPEDVTSGQSKGTFSSVKASRAPMSDRVSDEVAYFKRFLVHDFWGNIFFLKTMVSGFPAVFDQKQAVDFNNQKPVMKNVKRRPELLIEITFPVSETIDTEAAARAFLGVKHGSTYETLGIPNEVIAGKMGLGNYRKLRLRHATEMDKYPELALSVDQAAIEGQGVGKSGSSDSGKKGESQNPDAKPVKKPSLNRPKKEEK